MKYFFEKLTKYGNIYFIIFLWHLQSSVPKIEAMSFKPDTAWTKFRLDYKCYTKKGFT